MHDYGQGRLKKAETENTMINHSKATFFVRWEKDNNRRANTCLFPGQDEGIGASLYAN